MKIWVVRFFRNVTRRFVMTIGKGIAIASIWMSVGIATAVTASHSADAAVFMGVFGFCFAVVATIITADS